MPGNFRMWLIDDDDSAPLNVEQIQFSMLFMVVVCFFRLELEKRNRNLIEPCDWLVFGLVWFRQKSEFVKYKPNESRVR